MSVRRAQQEVDAQEFAEWMAYARVEPFGESRADLRCAIIACVLANIWARKGRRYKPSDFMPEFDRSVKRQSAAQMEQILAGFMVAHNAANGKK